MQGSIERDLDETCSEVLLDSTRDGEALEELSEDVGCSDAFEAYLDCIDEASCGYAAACEGQVVELEACGIEARLRRVTACSSGRRLR